MAQIAEANSWSAFGGEQAAPQTACDHAGNPSEGKGATTPAAAPSNEDLCRTAHAAAAEEIIVFLETDVQVGLNSSTARDRLNKYGLNKLADPVSDTIFQQIWRQVNQVLIWILLIACIVSGAVQSWPEFGLIIAVVVINVILGVLQEGKASKATAALRNMLSSKATVIRDGDRVEINAEQVVPGDIVLIESGDKIPADLRMIEVSNLHVQEAMLTGESLPVEKSTEMLENEAGIGDRKNMCYSATLVIKGQGKGICIATGGKTEFGRIAELVASVKEPETNLQKQMDSFGRWVGILVLPVALVTFLVALLTPVGVTEDGDSSKNKAEQSFILTAAIAVSMIPAGLPAVITICLAIATTNMARRNAVVKTLPSVETLGSVMVICSDKTGTLTKNEMTVALIRTQGAQYEVTGVGYDPDDGSINGLNSEYPINDTALVALINGSVLNNESRIERDEKSGRVVPIGDPMECALCCVAQKSRLDVDMLISASPRVGIIPFDSEHKFMVTIHRDTDEESYLVIVKGAPERLAMKSNTVLTATGEQQAFDEGFWDKEIELLSKRGYRCLAICQARVPATDLPRILSRGAAWFSESEAFLTFTGVFAILDPPRPECIAAIKEAHSAGIQVKMITGDHPETARSIAIQLGIVDNEGAQVLTGSELDSMTIKELNDTVVGCNIFARASPSNKISIVQALQNNEKVCCMTGDGVNDAPALQAADIGVAMGITGSDVSKDAAKIILTDDNFATILVAVKEGRRVWDNIRKMLFFIMPTAVAQGGIIFFAVCLQWTVVPLTAVQVLYVNMITSCTLGFIYCVEPAESTVMQRPPRRRDKGLIGSFFYWRNAYVAVIMICFSLGAVSWITTINQTKYGPEAQRAIAFNCLVFCQIGYMFSCRFLTQSSLHQRSLKGNKAALVSAIVVAVLNVIITVVPGLNTFFSMSSMDGVQWGIVVLFAIASFLLIELEKALSMPLRPITRPIVKSLRGTVRRIKCSSCSRGGK